MWFTGETVFMSAVHGYWECGEKSPNVQRVHGNVCHAGSPHHHRVPASEFPPHQSITHIPHECSSSNRFLYLPQTQVSWMPYCSMVLIFLFIFFFSSGPGMFITLDLGCLLRFFFYIEPSCINKPLQCSCPSAGATSPIPGEIFTQAFKSAGYMTAFSLNWLGLFVLGILFPIIVVSTVFNHTEKT